MKLTKQNRGRKGRFLRFLTLVCFFHFSGLNNGIAYFATLTGQELQAGFAPVAVRKAVRIFQPKSWKKLACGRSWSRLFSRSGQVIEVASQRVIREILIEAILFQMCMKNGLAGGGEVREDSEERQAAGGIMPRAAADGACLKGEGKSSLKRPVRVPARSREEIWLEMKGSRPWDWEKRWTHWISDFGLRVRSGEWSRPGDLSACVIKEARRWDRSVRHVFRRWLVHQWGQGAGNGIDESRMGMGIVPSFFVVQSSRLCVEAILI